MFILGDVKTGSIISKSIAPDANSELYAVSFCNDSALGNCYVSGGADKFLRIWDKRDPAKVITRLKGHQGSVNCVRFTYDARSSNIGRIYLSIVTIYTKSIFHFY